MDTTQDVYIKGFIFPTFTEKYLAPLLSQAGMSVTYVNLNQGNIEEKLEYILQAGHEVYTHLTANKHYSYRLFRRLINRKILVGGPLPKFRPELFEEDVLIDTELEEDGILQYFNMAKRSLWSDDSFVPSRPKRHFSNQTIEADFSEIVLFNRGCRYKCKFCIHSAFHKSMHTRGVKSIEYELGMYANEPVQLYIADPSINNLLILNDIIALLKSFDNISYSMNIRADQINPALLARITDLKIDKLYIGVESLDDAQLNRYSKGETVATITSRINLVKEYGIPYHLSFIISDNMDIHQFMTFHHLVNAASYSFHFYLPYPGTTAGGPISTNWFMDKNWPENISKLVSNSAAIKQQLTQLMNYPSNSYHTITPHDHSLTFLKIRENLEVLERMAEPAIRSESKGRAHEYFR